MRGVFLPVIMAATLLGCTPPPTGDGGGQVDLWTAAATGNHEVIERYVADGADIDAKEPAGGSSPLIVAAVYGQADTVRLLLDKGASLDVRNNDGATPLHVAAFFAHPDAVVALLEQGADTTATNGFGQTPLQTIEAEWSADIAGVYSMIAGMWNLDLDLERIERARPQVAELLRAHEQGG